MNFVCNEVETHLSDFIAEQCDAKTRRLVKAHLENCSACRVLVREQTAIRHQLRLLAKRDETQIPPAHLWEHAVSAWDLQDNRQKRPGKLRLALAGSSMLLLLLSIVWANIAPTREFPIEAVLRNFREVQSKPPVPMCPTEDPDKAARWLRENLRAELPPVNLTLSHGVLLGADVIVAPQQSVGRLLYRTPRGIAAVYIAPGSAHFTRTSEMPVGNQTFYIRNASDVGMYGWDANTVGCGLLMKEPIGNGRNLAINAAHSTEEKEP